MSPTASTDREQNTSAPTSLHKIYLKYLWQFEKDQREEKGLPPICQPRLPVATCPGKGTGKAKGEKEPGEKKGEELLMMDYAPNIQFMVNRLDFKNAQIVLHREFVEKQ